MDESICVLPVICTWTEPFWHLMLCGWHLGYLPSALIEWDMPLTLEKLGNSRGSSVGFRMCWVLALSSFWRLVVDSGRKHRAMDQAQLSADDHSLALLQTLIIRFMIEISQHILYVSFIFNTKVQYAKFAVSSYLLYLKFEDKSSSHPPSKSEACWENETWHFSTLLQSRSN